jgi:hypothetical protein
MKLLKRAFYLHSALYAPVRGRVLSGKWEKVIQQQNFHNQNWKQLSNL